jgi:hypothetical protein
MHPRLEALLEKYNITPVEWYKKGRATANIVQIRSAFITELHNEGTSWADMIAITGFSNGCIQRLTRAKGNPKTRERRAEMARKVGRAGLGRKRPGQLERMWEAGVFDHLRGMKLSEERCEKLKASWTEERRQHLSQRKIEKWREPGYREKLMAFHTSMEERARRSQAQSLRMAENPNKWARGRGAYVMVTKVPGKSTIWTRSSYERRAVLVLESDPTVSAYTYEPPLRLPNGKEIRPDFVVCRTDGTVCLIEVKASWVLGLDPSHKVLQRLDVARKEAYRRGWDFNVWTEKDVLHVVVE